MRLGTCIAIELVVAAGTLAGAWLGVGWAIDRASEYTIGREAEADPAVEPSVALAAMPVVAMPVVTPIVEPEPPAPPRLATAVAEPAGSAAATVFEGPDAELLAPIDAAPLAHVKVNRGGSSLSLRLEFANGSRAAFKPTQIHPQSDPRRELAAYRIDRLLGIGHVQPAKAGAVRVDDIVAAADPAIRGYLAGRIDAEAIAPRGVLRGAMSWWIPEIKDGQIAGHALDDPDGMATWARYLQADATMPAELRPLLAQISTCVVFDVVIDNADRWSGTNTKTSPDGATLYFMDNTLSFSPYTLGHTSNLTPLHRISVFPRALVARLRAITLAEVTAAIAGDGRDAGLAPLLSDAELRAIIARRDHIVRYIDQLVGRFGEDAVLALP